MAVIGEKECPICGKKFVPPTLPLIEKSYPHLNEEIKRLMNLCPECRKKEAFERLYQ